MLLSSFFTNFGVGVGPLCSLSSSVTWAIGSVGYSQLTQKYSPFAVNFVRALIALPLFVATVFFLAGGFSAGVVSYQSVRASHWGWFALSMIASYGLGDTFFLWSARLLGVPSALAIASSFPIWTVFAGYFFSHEKVSLFQMVGLLLTVCGIVVVIISGSGRPQKGKSLAWRGVLLAIATSVAWATNTFASAQGGLDLPAAVGNTLRMIWALVMCFSFGKILAPQSKILLPYREVMRCLWFFVLEAFCGSFLFLYGLSHSPLALGSTLSSLAPVVSVPVAVLFGVEKFSFLRTFGVILAVLGVCFLLTY